MKHIGKYIVDEIEQVVTLPAGATILYCEFQRSQFSRSLQGDYVIRAAVDLDAPPLKRSVRIIPAGGEPPGDRYQYLSTVEESNGMVCRVYIEKTGSLTMSDVDGYRGGKDAR